jgi:hypothetical protein
MGEILMPSRLTQRIWSKNSLYISRAGSQQWALNGQMLA